MSATYTFKWPAGPNEVILTGTFDNWSKTLPLVKQADGSFELTVPLPAESGKLLYKYVVDGEWLVAKDQKVTKDDGGIDNNVLEKEDLVSSSSVNGSKIPEAGGLVSAAVASEGVKTTVMPETKNTPTIAGEPGLQVPKDAANISAFTEVNDVDAKKFNDDLTAEEKKKQKKKVKRSQYKAKKKKKAQEAAAAGGISNSNTTATSSAPETSEAEFGATPEPESQPSNVAAVVSPSTEAFENAREEATSKDAPLDAQIAPPIDDAAEEKETFPVSTLDPRAQANAKVDENKAAKVVELVSNTKADGNKAAKVDENKAAKVVELVSNAEDSEPVVAETKPASEEVAKVPEHNIEESVAVPAAAAAAAASTSANVHTNEVPAAATKNAAEEPVAATKAVVEEPATTTKAAIEEPVTSTKNTVEDSVEKEVDASPVKNLESVTNDEEIIIAKTNGNVAEIAAAIAAQEGDVTVEEFKPTDTEAAQLAKKVDASTKPATVETKQAPKQDTKEKKKSGRFSRIIKKLFK